MENLAMLAASPEAWAALATLIVLEVVLGIDNLIFISILTNRLPEADRPRARLVGISGALILRLALLSRLALRRGRARADRAAMPLRAARRRHLERAAELRFGLGFHCPSL